ncbi:hypothetical protein [Hydrogeniiclostridium mannosilyticum]|uniref:hypothetical protein n=1 Tax=Hydrogeniiclostridium mannosilyticum TaxID=2764322 RepID=UPI00399991DB
MEETRYTKRAKLKSEYQKIYDAVYDGIDRLEEDYAPGAVLFDFSGEDILFNEANGDTIYIPLGSIFNGLRNWNGCRPACWSRLSMRPPVS